MKKLLRVFLSMLFITSLISAPSFSQAETNIDPLTINEKKSLLVEVAREYDIPPEILIAIAYTESEFTQFEDGEPYTSDDNGYGMMQITDQDKVTEAVKYDTRANIEAGAKILNEKWQFDLPKVETEGQIANRDIIEHWYFAVMAYNGKADVNLPEPSDRDGDFDTEWAYQEKVFYHIESNGLLNLLDTSPDQGINIDAETITFDGQGTYSKMGYSKSDQVFVYNENRHGSMYGNVYKNEQLTESKRVPYYTQYQIVDPTIHFSPYNSQNNHYGYYQIERNGQSGYISSSNLALINQYQTDFTPFESNQTPAPTKVSPDKTFTISFNTEVTSQSVNKRNIYIVSEDGQGIDMSLSLMDGDSVEINPVGNLKSGATYTLYIKDVIANNSQKPLKEAMKHQFQVN